MAAPAIAAFRSLEPRFLEGLAPLERETILSAAKQRRYLANSVMANQGHPADHFFLLTSGRGTLFLYHA